MAQKFYVVWVGKKPGIYTDWDSCKSQVAGFAGAQYKSFKTRAEAEAALAADPKDALGKKSKPAPKKGPSAGPLTLGAEDVVLVQADTKIFTDGGCEPNPGKAASGLAVYRGGRLEELWFGLFNPNGTNNTAELNSLHQGLLMAEKELEAGSSVAIFCDSKYSIQCITRWAFNWQRNNWQRKDGEIKNLALIQEIFAVYRRVRAQVKVWHVNGHVGVEGNELADRMSIHGIDAQEVDFVRFAEELDLSEELDLKKILAMRTG